MFKSEPSKLAALIFVFSISFAGLCPAAATTYTWDRGAGTDDWNTGQNWSSDIVPPNNSSYYAAVTMATGPVVPASSTVNAYRIYLKGTNGTLTVSGGTVNVGNHLYMPDAVSNSAILNVNSGTVNVAGTFYVANGAGNPCVGTVNLTGGSITCNNLYINNNSATGGLIDLRGGTLTYTSLASGKTLDQLKANGWVVAYGGTGTVMADTTTIPGKTILSGQNQTKAVNPTPANNLTKVARNTILTWTAGNNATSHNVYLGTTNPPTILAGNVTAASFNPGTLDFDSTYYWRVDEVGSIIISGDVWNFSTVSGKSKTPEPASGTINVPVNKVLDWVANSFAVSHDVYFGTSASDVNITNRLFGDLNGNGSVDWLDILLLGNNWLADPAGTEPYVGLNEDNSIDFMDFALLAPDWQISAGPVFKGNQDSNSFNPGPLAIDTTYYWRVDEVNGPETAAGNIWSFTTQPAKAYNPNPAAGASALTNTALTWMAGAGAATHDIYFGTTTSVAFQANQASTTFDPGTLESSKTYYWKVDEIGSYGTVTGDLWSFTTAPLNTTPIYQYLTWRHDPTNSVVVSWFDPCSVAGDTTVDYGTTTLYGSTVVNSTSSIYHHVEITGLSPGTTYHYRPRSSNGTVGGDASFTTPTASPTTFRFVMFGDERGADRTTNEPFYTRHQQLCNWVLAQDYDFVLQGGDTVYVGGTDPTHIDGYPQWYDYYRLESNLSKAKVIMPTLGNHEVQDSGQDPYLFYSLYPEATPANGLPANAGVYSFDYGNAHFVSLSSYRANLNTQATWLANDLQTARSNPDIKWIFVFFHAPMYTTTTDGGRGNRTDEISNWGPVFDTYHVDIAFQSHNHIYERSYSLKAGAVVADGVGTIYLTNGLGGAGFEGLNSGSPGLFAVKYSAAAYTYGTAATCVTIMGNNLSCQTISQDNGAIRDSFTLTKP